MQQITGSEDCHGEILGNVRKNSGDAQDGVHRWGVRRPAGASFVGSPRGDSDDWQVNVRDMAALDHKK